MEESLLKIRRFLAGIIDISIYTFFYLLFFSVEGYLIKKHPEVKLFDQLNLIINSFLSLIILLRDYLSIGKFFTKLKIKNRTILNSIIRNFPFTIPFAFSAIIPYLKKSPIISRLEFIFVSIPVIYAVMELTLIILGSGNRIIDKFVKSEIVNKNKTYTK